MRWRERKMEGKKKMWVVGGIVLVVFGLLGSVVGQTEDVAILELVNSQYRAVTVKSAAVSTEGILYVGGQGRRTASSKFEGFVARVNIASGRYDWFRSIISGGDVTVTENLVVDSADEFVYITANNETTWALAKVKAGDGTIQRQPRYTGQASGRAIALASDETQVFVVGESSVRLFADGTAGAFVAAYSTSSLSLAGGKQMGVPGDVATHVGSVSNGVVVFGMNRDSNSAPFLRLVDSSVKEISSALPIIPGAMSYSTRGISVDLNGFIHTTVEVREKNRNGQTIYDMIFSSSSSNAMQFVRKTTICCDDLEADAESRGVSFGKDGNSYHTIVLRALGQADSSSVTYANQLNILSQFGVAGRPRQLSAGTSRSRFVTSVLSQNTGDLFFFANNVNNQVDLTHLSNLKILPYKDPSETKQLIQYRQAIVSPSTQMQSAARKTMEHLNALVIDAVGLVGKDRLRNEFFIGNLGGSITSTVTIQDFSGNSSDTINRIEQFYNRGDFIQELVGVTASLSTAPSVISDGTTPEPEPTTTASPKESDTPNPPDNRDGGSKETESGGLSSAIIIAISVVGGVVVLSTIFVICAIVILRKKQSSTAEVPIVCSEQQQPLYPTYTYSYDTSEQPPPTMQSQQHVGGYTVQTAGTFTQNVDTGFVLQ